MTRGRQQQSLSRFDHLPKEIWINIVSRLPFKEAVRTSVLQRSWINIWRHSTNMELNQNFFTNPMSLSDPAGTLGSVSFRVFSEKFMSEKRVKHLTIDLTSLQWNEQPVGFKSLELMDLPNEFYDHMQNIESLKLSSISISFLGCSHFTSLRSAFLHWIRFWKADLKRLAAEAPLLEDLRLKRCIVYKVKLASDSLKYLAIEECDIVNDTISLTTPNLKFFAFSGRASHLDLESASSSLRDVSVRFDLQPPKADFDGNIVCQQFKNFCHVKHLTVCSYTLQLLPTKMEDFKHLNLELSHLTIKVASFGTSMFRGFIFFVKSCPLTETLTIDLSRESHLLTGSSQAPLEENESYKFKTLEDHVGGTCLSQSLRVVEIKGCDGDKTCLLMEFLSIMMRHGKALEKIIWQSSSTDSKEIEELRKLAKASPRVQIICGD